MKHALALVLLSLFWFAPAHAQSCALTSAGTLIDFGPYTSAGGAVDVQGSLALSCTTAAPLHLPVSYSIGIGKGSAPSFSPRTLKFGGNSLNYNLFTDLTRLIVWGDGSVPVTTSKVAGTCSGSCSNFVYGRVLASQSVPAGTYSDSVLVTVDF